VRGTGRCKFEVWIDGRFMGRGGVKREPAESVISRLSRNKIFIYCDLHSYHSLVPSRLSVSLAVYINLSPPPPNI
jgi:hypothetical protein